ncbi:MAG: hypothetical protein HY648_12695 [Acidobacteria bacterium]|nr:hypothetical protein [Acidobacteriota bacterium]
MLRKLAVWLLLIPLPLNGLWMVCGEAPSAANASTDSAEVREEMADCEQMCPLDQPAKEGAICLLTADGSGSMSVILFGVAVLPLQTVLHPPVLARQYLSELAHDKYVSPCLDRATPPPRVKSF